MNLYELPVTLPHFVTVDVRAVQGHRISHDGPHLHQRHRLWRPGTHFAAPGPGHARPPVPGGCGCGHHPVRHLLPHGAGQDTHADAGHGREEVQAEALQELCGLPTAHLQPGGRARHQPRDGDHPHPRDTRLRRLLPDLRRPHALAGLRAGRLLHDSQAAVRRGHVGHRLLALHLPGRRHQVAPAGGRRGRGQPVQWHRGLRAAERAEGGLAGVHARPHLHAAARLSRQCRNLRDRDSVPPVYAGRRRWQRLRACSQEPPAAAAAAPGLQPVNLAPPAGR